MPRMGYLIRLAISAVALWITTLLISGVQVTTDSTAKKIGTIVAVAAIFGIINAIIRPVVKTIGCAFYVLTLGLIAIVVNGLLFLLTSAIAGGIGLPFHVENFWPSAVLGAIIVGLVSWGLSLIVPDKKR
jgi:putative membrane protein